MEMTHNTSRHGPHRTANMVRLNNKIKLHHHIAPLKSLELQENHPVLWSNKALEHMCNLKLKATALL